MAHWKAITRWYHDRAHVLRVEPVSSSIRSKSDIVRSTQKEELRVQLIAGAWSYFPLWSHCHKNIYKESFGGTTVKWMYATIALFLKWSMYKILKVDPDSTQSLVAQHAKQPKYRTSVCMSDTDKIFTSEWYFRGYFPKQCVAYNTLKYTEPGSNSDFLFTSGVAELDESAKFAVGIWLCIHQRGKICRDNFYENVQTWAKKWI